MFMQVLPIGAALVMAITMVGGMALATRAILRTRQLDARYHQTFAALLATNAALTFLLVPFFAPIPPMLPETASPDRKSVVWGTRVSLQVKSGGCLIIKKNNHTIY